MSVIPKEVLEYVRLFKATGSDIGNLCWICREAIGSTGEHILTRASIDRYFDYSNNRKRPVKPS